MTKFLDYISTIFSHPKEQEGILVVFQVLLLLSPLIIGVYSVFYFTGRGRGAIGAFSFVVGFCLMAHLWIPAFICLIPLLFLNVKIWKDWYWQLWKSNYMWVVSITVAVIAGIFSYFWFKKNILASSLMGLFIALLLNFILPYTLFYCVLFPLSKLFGRKKTVIVTVERKEKDYWNEGIYSKEFNLTVVGFNLKFEEFADEFCASRKFFNSLIVGDRLQLEMVYGLCKTQYCIKYKRLGQPE